MSVDILLHFCYLNHPNINTILKHSLILKQEMVTCSVIE